MNQKFESEKNPGFIKDLAQFLILRRKWWLVPIALVLILFGGIVILGGTSAAPFIYSLF